MNSFTKVLIPNKEWLLKDEQGKIGSIQKMKKGYAFFKKGRQVEFHDLSEIKNYFHLDHLDETPKTARVEQKDQNYTIYDFPCSNKPFEPLYSVKKKLPLFAKSSKSKSQYCAGYYIIKFRKGWVKSFCPKLITLDRYPYYGPFKTEQEMKLMLNNVNKS